MESGEKEGIVSDKESSKVVKDQTHSSVDWDQKLEVRQPPRLSLTLDESTVCAYDL